MKRHTSIGEVVYFSMLITLAILATLTLCEQCLGDELPPAPVGVVREVDGEQLLCYDREQAQLIAQYVRVIVPMQREHILLLERDVDLLEQDGRLLRQQLWNLELALENHSYMVESAELSASLQIEEVALLRTEWVRERKLHWAAHGIGLVALSVLSGLYVYERIE